MRMSENQTRFSFPSHEAESERQGKIVFERAAQPKLIQKPALAEWPALEDSRAGCIEVKRGRGARLLYPDFLQLGFRQAGGR